MRDLHRQSEKGHHLCQPKAESIRHQVCMQKSESLIVVRARESRVHGEGVDRSKDEEGLIGRHEEK